ncbi:hypothetical protein KY284_032684 [Solanum tuberosum]|nr:hypothetical protein KY284_032684 [Solanum tuberosum]
MIQGHNEQQCYVVHPELYPHKEKTGQDDGKKIEEITRKEDNKGKEGEKHNGRKNEEFVEYRHKIWGRGRHKETEKVWNKVGILTGNKFNLLESGNQDTGKEQEKDLVNENEVEMESVPSMDRCPLV